jgi:hypothetical protein
VTGESVRSLEADSASGDLAGAAFDHVLLSTAFDGEQVLMLPCPRTNEQVRR